MKSKIKELIIEHHEKYGFELYSKYYNIEIYDKYFDFIDCTDTVLLKNDNRSKIRGEAINWYMRMIGSGEDFMEVAKMIRILQQRQLKWYRYTLKDFELSDEETKYIRDKYPSLHFKGRENKYHQKMYDDLYNGDLTVLKYMFKYGINKGFLDAYHDLHLKINFVRKKKL